MKFASREVHFILPQRTATVKHLFSKARKARGALRRPACGAKRAKGGRRTGKLAAAPGASRRHMASIY